MSRAHALNQEFAAIVKNERRITREIVRRIAEFEVNCYYAELGYDSIMGWLVEGHGYTKSAAWRRMQAARLVTTVPSALNKIATGEVNLTTLASLQTAIRQEEKRTKSDISKEQKAELVQMIESQSSEKVDRIIAVQFPELDLEKKEFVKPISATETKYTLVFSEEDQNILTRLKEVTSHSHFNASWSELYIVAAKEYLKRHDPLLKKSIKVRESAEQPSVSKASKDESREITATSVTIALDTPKKNKPNRETSLSRPWTAARKALTRTDDRRETETGRTSDEHRALTEQNSVGSEESIVFERAGSASEPNFQENPSSAAAPDFVYTNSSSAPAPRFENNEEPVARELRNQVLRECEGSCEFIDLVAGKRCASRHMVEVDHIIPRSLGGSNERRNLRGLCRTHNFHSALEKLGTVTMSQFTSRW